MEQNTNPNPNPNPNMNPNFGFHSDPNNNTAQAYRPQTAGVPPFGAAYPPPPPYYQAAPAPRRSLLKRFELNGFDRGFAALMTGLTVLFVIFAVGGGWNAGFTAAFVIMFAVYSIYLAKKDSFPGVYAIVCGALALLLSAVFFCTTDSTVRFLSLAAVFCNSSVWFYSLAGRNDKKGEFGFVGGLFSNSFGVIFANLFPTLRSVFSDPSPDASERKAPKISGRTGKILLSLLAAVPVAAIVIRLLSKADAAFENVIGLTLGNIGSVIGRTVVGLILAPFTIAFAFGLKKTKDSPDLPEKAKKGLDTAFTVPFLGVISLCYLVYLFAQLAYFFSAFSGLLPDENITYAGYARRGFFELCWIAAINFVIVFAVLLISRLKKNRLPVSVKILCTFISLFTLLIIATAVSKMFMYIKEFGMTYDRLSSSAFMLFLAVVFLSLILRCYIPSVRVTKVGLTAASVVLIVLGIGNMSAFIASYNYDFFALPENKMTVDDVYYIDGLGAEGVETVVKIAENSTDKEVKDAALESVAYYVKWGYYEDGDLTKRTEGAPWEKNIAKEKAYAAIESFYAAHKDEVDRKVKEIYVVDEIF